MPPIAQNLPAAAKPGRGTIRAPRGMARGRLMREGGAMTTPHENDWASARTQLVEAWADTSRAVLELTDALTAEQAGAPTPCAEWSVRDVLAHLAAIEVELVGGPGPRLVRRPGRSLLDDYTESGVAQRRDLPLEQVRQEYAAACATRRATLAADPPPDPKALPAHTPGGQPWNWRRVLTNRVVDTWVHELDLCVGLGRPIRWEAPAAPLFLRYAAEQLQRAAAASAAAAATAATAPDGEPPVALPIEVVVDGAGPDGQPLRLQLVAHLPARVVTAAGGGSVVGAAVRIDTDLPGIVGLTTSRAAFGGRVQLHGRLAGVVAERLLVVG